MRMRSNPMADGFIKSRKFGHKNTRKRMLCEDRNTETQGEGH